jgi:hypothetical protein
MSRRRPLVRFFSVLVRCLNWSLSISVTMVVVLPLRLPSPGKPSRHRVHCVGSLSMPVRLFRVILSSYDCPIRFLCGCTISTSPHIELIAFIQQRAITLASPSCRLHDFAGNSLFPISICSWAVGALFAVRRTTREDSPSLQLDQAPSQDGTRYLISLLLSPFVLASSQPVCARAIPPLIFRCV